jgi:hypothetical protein
MNRATPPKDKGVNNRTLAILLAVASAAALSAIAVWYQATVAVRVSRAQFVAGSLQPIATLLQEDQALLKELQAEPFTEKDSGILESYLAKIRRDGVRKNVEMKQRLDQLAENNTAIVTLIKAYAPHAKTVAFTTEGDKFRNYASAWRDRWNSVMELFMAGGNYAAAGVVFPNGFPPAVDAEITATR